MGVIYRDLLQFGMPFVTPDDPRFRELANQIPLDPFGIRRGETPPEAVVVLNQSGEAALIMSVLWKWADKNGQVTEQRMPGLHSLAQLDWRAEGTDQRRMWFHPFLAGSKRLITPHGIFGDNSDVLPPEAKPSGFGGSAGMSRSGRGQPERFLLEVQLDSVIFADGRFAGPDEMGLLATVGSAAVEQRRIASEAAALLRRGGQPGEVFELVRSFARPPGPSMTPRIVDPLHLLFSFGRQAVDRLIHARDDRREELIGWFEAQSEQPRLELRRRD